MKTNIFKIKDRYFVKTGKILVYEEFYPILDNEDDVVDYDYLYAYDDEIVDVCTGEKYRFDGIMFFEIGNPIDAYDEHEKINKRGRHSRSNNKQAARLARETLRGEDLPF